MGQLIRCFEGLAQTSQVPEGKKGCGGRGRRTSNLRIKSRRVGSVLACVSTFKSQSLTNKQARTEAIWSGIETNRVGAHRLKANGTLMAHRSGVNPSVETIFGWHTCL